MMESESQHCEFIETLTDTINDIDFTRLILRKAANDLKRLRQDAEEAYINGPPLSQILGEDEDEDESNTEDE